MADDPQPTEQGAAPAKEGYDPKEKFAGEWPVEWDLDTLPEGADKPAPRDD